MVSRPRVLATICARGGSKGVPRKNLTPLAGRSLLVWAIDCVRACRAVDALVISTDDEELAEAAEAHGVPVPFRRPAEMASDQAAKVHAIRHATEWMERKRGLAVDIVVDLDVGVPLRAPEDITGCVQVLLDDPSLDAAVTLYEPERNPYFNMVQRDGDVFRLVCRPDPPVVRRQDAPEVYSVSPSVFAFRRAAMGRVVHLADGRWGGLVVPRERAIDIDTPFDLAVVESLVARRER
jgi:CMP-N,N'-diacetyllegionaminic acid synthase